MAALPEFNEVRLPEDVERGIRTGPRIQVTITKMQSGREDINVDWEKFKWRGDVAYGIQTASEYQFVLNLFYANFGPAIGFRVKDWGDFAAVDEQFGLGDDTTTQFQLGKNYPAGNLSYFRPLYKIVASPAPVIKLDGGALTDPTHYSLDGDTGVVTMVTAPASTGGTGPGGEEVLTWDGQFDIPVRFVNMEMDIVQQIFQDEMAAEIPSIPLIEKWVT